MADPNPIDVQRYLRGVDYPVPKSTLIDTAEDAGANDTVLSALEGLPERDYDRPTDVSSELAGS